MKKQSNIIKDISKIVVFLRMSMVFYWGLWFVRHTQRCWHFHRNFIGVGRSLLTKCISDEKMGCWLIWGSDPIFSTEKKGKVGSRWLIFWSPTLENLPHPTLQAFLQCIGLISWICWWMFQSVGPFFFRQRNENKIWCKNEYGNLPSKMRTLEISLTFFQNCNPSLFLWIVVGVTILKFFCWKSTHFAGPSLGILSPKLRMGMEFKYFAFCFGDCTPLHHPLTFGGWDP